MSVDFAIKQNDTRPKLRATLMEGGPVDLTSATSVKFLMRPRPLTGRTAVTTPKVSAAAAFIAPRTSGVVEYTWAAGDTDTVGVYDAEFEVTWGDGGIETFPAGEHSGADRPYYTIEVEDDLG